MSADIQERSIRALERMAAGMQTQTLPEYSAEYIRAARHHDVLCLVLKEFMHNMTHYVQKPEPGYRESMVNTARAIADLAYPPTHLCALVDCQKAEPHDHPISGPYCTPPKAEEP